MKAEEWMSRNVQTCTPETSMAEAAQKMWAADCGVLPVVGRDGRVVGMITDRDICMGAHFQGKRLADMGVADSMSRSVFACQSSDSIEEVIRRMGDSQVRRVPVLGTDGRPVGIISLNDLARRLLSLGERERSRLVPRFVEALAVICETRAGAVPEPVPRSRNAAQPLMVG